MLRGINVKIYGVEPEGAASALAAIHEDQVVTLAEANTIADGTAVKTIIRKHPSIHNHQQ